MSGIWTRNYTNALCAAFGRIENNSDAVGVSEYSSTNLSVKRTNGAIMKINCEIITDVNAALKQNGILLGSPTTTLYGYYLGICVGTGTTPVTYEDFRLETYIASGLTLVTALPTVTNTYNSTSHAYKFKRTFSLQNTTLSPIVISELGLCLQVSKRDHGVASLIYHEVFEAVTLDPNDTFLVTIEQEMPLYNYQPYPV